MKNVKGAYGSKISILNAAVFTLVMMVILLGGVLVAHDVSAGMVKADLAEDNQPAMQSVIDGSNAAITDSNFEIRQTDRLTVLPMPIMISDVTDEGCLGCDQIITMVPTYLCGSIDPGGQQIPIIKPKL